MFYSLRQKCTLHITTQPCEWVSEWFTIPIITYNSSQHVQHKSFHAIICTWNDNWSRKSSEKNTHRKKHKKYTAYIMYDVATVNAECSQIHRYIAQKALWLQYNGTPSNMLHWYIQKWLSTTRISTAVCITWLTLLSDLMEWIY